MFEQNACGPRFYVRAKPREAEGLGIGSACRAWFRGSGPRNASATHVAPPEPLVSSVRWKRSRACRSAHAHSGALSHKKGRKALVLTFQCIHASIRARQAAAERHTQAGRRERRRTRKQNNAGQQVGAMARTRAASRRMEDSRKQGARRPVRQEVAWRLWVQRVGRCYA